MRLGSVRSESIDRSDLQPASAPIPVSKVTARTDHQQTEPSIGVAHLKADEAVSKAHHERAQFYPRMLAVIMERHRQLYSLPFFTTLNDKTLSEALFLQYLANQAAIFSAVEKSLEEHKDEPWLNAFYEKIEPIRRGEVYSTDLLKLSSEFKLDIPVPNEKTVACVEELQKSVQSNPRLLISAVYVYYPGQLRGDFVVTCVREWLKTKMNEEKVASSMSFCQYNDLKDKTAYANEIVDLYKGLNPSEEEIVQFVDATRDFFGSAIKSLESLK